MMDNTDETKVLLDETSTPSEVETTPVEPATTLVEAELLKTSELVSKATNLVNSLNLTPVEVPSDFKINMIYKFLSSLSEEFPRLRCITLWNDTMVKSRSLENKTARKAVEDHVVNIFDKYCKENKEDIINMSLQNNIKMNNSMYIPMNVVCSKEKNKMVVYKYLNSLVDPSSAVSESKSKSNMTDLIQKQLTKLPSVIQEIPSIFEEFKSRLEILVEEKDSLRDKFIKIARSDELIELFDIAYDKLMNSGIDWDKYVNMAQDPNVLNKGRMMFNTFAAMSGMGGGMFN